MKNIPHFFIFYILILSFYGCGNRDHVWNEESNRVAREVRNTLNKYYEDINREGFSAEFRYLDSSAMFSWHPPGYAGPIPYDSVKIALLRNESLFQNVQLTWDSLIVKPETNEKATYVGWTTSTLTDTAGHATTYHLFEEGVLLKRIDGWKLVSGKTVTK